MATPGNSDMDTLLGVWVIGVIVIAVDPACPAGGTTPAPACGPIVKSGIFTFTKAGFADANAKFVSP